MMSQLLLLLPELAKEEVRHVFRHLFCSYGTESDQCNLKNPGFLEAKAKQCYQESILVKPRIPSSWSVLQFPSVCQVPHCPNSTFCQIYMVHLSKKFGQKDFFYKILIINQVDTPRLIPCSTKNCLNTFSNELAKRVGEERDVGKAVCEERECSPAQGQTRGTRAKHSARRELGLRR